MRHGIIILYTGWLIEILTNGLLEFPPNWLVFHYPQKNILNHQGPFFFLIAQNGEQIFTPVQGMNTTNKNAESLNTHESFTKSLRFYMTLREKLAFYSMDILLIFPGKSHQNAGFSTLLS